MPDGDRVAPMFPPKDKVTASNVRLEEGLWDRLDAIAKAEDKSRNDVIAFFLKWACDDYDKEKAKKARR